MIKKSEKAISHTRTLRVKLKKSEGTERLKIFMALVRALEKLALKKRSR